MTTTMVPNSLYLLEGSFNTQAQDILKHIALMFIDEQEKMMDRTTWVAETKTPVIKYDRAIGRGENDHVLAEEIVVQWPLCHMPIA